MKKTAVILIILNIIAFFALDNVSYVESASKTSSSEDPLVQYGTEDFIRLHVRANSDSVEDQVLKLMVRDEILKYTTSVMRNVSDKNAALEKVNESLGEIKKVAEKTITEKGYPYKVNVEVKKEYFEYREYDGFFLPADTYDSLLVNIGKAEGHNWWCVIYPAVCLSGSSEIEKTNKNKDIKDFKTSLESPGKSENETENAHVSVNLEAVPKQYRLAENPVSEKTEVKYEFWIVKMFKNLFK